MKRYTSLFLAIAFIAGMITSCSDDGFWEKSSQTDLGLTNGTAYTFNSSSLSYTYYPADVTEGMEFPITITRGQTSGTFTLPVKATFSDSVMLSGPASVTFADGSNTAEYVIHVNKEVAIGQSVSASLLIDTLSMGIPKVDLPIAPKNTLDSTSTAADSAAYMSVYTKYQADSTDYEIYMTKLKAYKMATTVTISKDYNWKSLGRATVVENFWFENGDAPASIELRQAVENPKIFRLVNPWKAIADAAGAGLNGNQMNIQFTLLQPGDVIAEQTITQNDLVYFDRSNTGYHHSSYDADVWILHPAEFTNTGTEDKWLYNKVLSYQANGLPAVVQLAPRYYMFGVGGWNNSQADDVFMITFPGVKIFDYSADIAYAGLFTDVDNTVYALADYELSGADAQAAQVKVAVISDDDDMEAVADAIAAGDFEAYDLSEVASDGRIQVAIPADMTGKLKIIMVIIDNNDEGAAEVKNVVAAGFEYYSGANPWKSLGMGIYTDDLVYPLYTEGNPSTTYEVEIEENSEIPGLYRLVDPYGPNFPYFEYADAYTSTKLIVHAEDPEAVYIPEQSTGLTLSSGDGEMSIVTVGADYYAYYGDEKFEDLKENGFFGTLVDGVMTFPSFAAKDDDGNVRYTYQGYVLFPDDSYYSMGRNGEMKIVLPGAVTASARNAARFATNLNKYNVQAKRNLKKGGLKAQNDDAFKRLAKEIKLKKTFQKAN